MPFTHEALCSRDEVKFDLSDSRAYSDKRLELTKQQQQICEFFCENFENS